MKTNKPKKQPTPKPVGELPILCFLKRLSREEIQASTSHLLLTLETAEASALAVEETLAFLNDPQRSRTWSRRYFSWILCETYGHDKSGGQKCCDLQMVHFLQREGKLEQHFQDVKSQLFKSLFTLGPLIPLRNFSCENNQSSLGCFLQHCL